LLETRLDFALEVLVDSGGIDPKRSVNALDLEHLGFHIILPVNLDAVFFGFTCGPEYVNSLS
jgi:hypothetical protein